MEEVQLSFEAVSGTDRWALIIGASVALLAGTWMIWLLRRKKGDRNRQITGAMLLFFLALLGAGAAVFGAWSLHKLEPVQFLERELNTPYGRIAYRDITDAYLSSNKAVAPVWAYQKRDLLLVIEGKDQVHVLSERNYRIREIFEQLKTRIRDAKE